MIGMFFSIKVHIDVNDLLLIELDLLVVCLLSLLEFISSIIFEYISCQGGEWCIHQTGDSMTIKFFITSAKWCLIHDIIFSSLKKRT